VKSNRRTAGLALAGLAAILAGMTLSGCSSDGVFPAVHDMPAARTETKLTPDEVTQATNDLLYERDRTEAQGQTQGQTPGQPQTATTTATTTGSGSSKKHVAPTTQSQAQQPPISISAYAKQ
jgi:hypothetical protein